MDRIQSPYIHRASGLAQIAVSTVLRPGTTGNREFLRAEHCRYGTRDLAMRAISPEKVGFCLKSQNPGRELGGTA